MSKVVLIGAGGKMGYRLTRNLLKSDYQVDHVEVSEAGRARLQDELGVTCVAAEDAVPNADVVILAVPDSLIGRISADLNPMIKSGTMVITLDAAAPFAGHLPERDDVVYFVSHPCHPTIFNDEEGDARRDFFGGELAKQSIVNALMQGDQKYYAIGEDIAKKMYAPIKNSYEVTVDQMALLEPGLSETVVATLLAVMREAMDEVVDRGVDKGAARDFLLGHMNILAAVIFEELEGVQFSDACNKAIVHGKPVLIKDDWKRLFEREEIAASIQRIT